MENVYIHFIASIFVRIDLCKFRVNIEVTTISKFISQLHTHTHSYASSLIIYRYTYRVCFGIVPEFSSPELSKFMNSSFCMLRHRAPHSSTSNAMGTVKQNALTIC